MSSRVYQYSNEYFSSRQSFEAELREAFLCGMKQGRSEGYNQGFSEGEQQGYREGYQVRQTKFRSILAEETEEAYIKGNKTGFDQEFSAGYQQCEENSNSFLVISTTISRADASTMTIKTEYVQKSTASVQSMTKPTIMCTIETMTDNDFAMPTQLMDNATVSFSSPPTLDASPAASTDSSISAQTSPIFTCCDFVFLQDVSSTDINLGTRLTVRAADVRISTTSTSVSIGNSAKPTSSSMLTGASFSSLSSAVFISNYKPSSQSNSADEDTFSSSFASDFSEDLPLPFAILGLSSYKSYTPDTFRGGGDFEFFISILALHFDIAGVCRGNIFHHPLINLYMSTPDLSQQK